MLFWSLQFMLSLHVCVWLDIYLSGDSLETVWPYLSVLESLIIRMCCLYSALATSLRIWSSLVNWCLSAHFIMFCMEKPVSPFVTDIHLLKLSTSSIWTTVLKMIMLCLNKASLIECLSLVERNRYNRQNHVLILITSLVFSEWHIYIVYQIVVCWWKHDVCYKLFIDFHSYTLHR